MENLINSIGDIFSHSVIQTAGTGHSPQSKSDLVSTASFKVALKKCITSQETEAYVTNHLKYLKWQMGVTNLNESEMATLLQQCLICQSLGYDVSFAGIYAIQLSQSAQEWKNKLLAYCACNVLLNPGNDLTILMVATLHRDIISRDINCILLALHTASAMLTADLIPALDHVVCDRTHHPSPLVRRNAVACLGSFLQKVPESAEAKLPIYMECLRDKDPKTMAIALQIINGLEDKLLLQETDTLAKVLLHILSQIVAGNLPQGMTRGKVGGAHILIKAVQLLTRLCRGNDTWRPKILLSLLSVLDKYDKLNSTTAVAVVTECCLTLPDYSESKIHVERAVHYAGLLLHSDCLNYRATGLRILTRLAALDKGLVHAHQQTIVAELKSTDTTLADRAMNLILQIISSNSLKQVYQLYEKCATSKDQYAYKEKGLEILLKCNLSDIDIEWFYKGLMDLIGMEPLGDSSINGLLYYISKQDEECRLKLLNLLSCGDHHASCDIVLVLILWLVLSCEAESTALPDIGEKMLIAIQSCSITCEAVLESNFIHLLLLARDAVRNGKISLTSDQLERITDAIRGTPSYIAAYSYLSELSFMSEQSEAETTGADSQEIEALDELFTDMDRHTREQVETKSCRDASSDGGLALTDQAKLKFTKQADSKPQKMKTQKNVTKSSNKWTLQGLNTEGSEFSTHDTNSGNPMTVQSQDEVQALADAIFSS